LKSLSSWSWSFVYGVRLGLIWFFHCFSNLIIFHLDEQSSQHYLWDSFYSPQVPARPLYHRSSLTPLESHSPFALASVVTALSKFYGVILSHTPARVSPYFPERIPWYLGPLVFHVDFKINTSSPMRNPGTIWWEFKNFLTLQLSSPSTLLYLSFLKC
jgi:hypothetical protein